MRIVSPVLLLCGLLILLATPAPAADPADARAIIDRAIKAAGGEAKMEKFKAQTWKEKGTFHGEGKPLPYTSVCAMQFPDQFRMEIVGFFTMVVNGDKGWTKEKGKTAEMNQAQLANQKDSMYGGWVASLQPLKDKAYTLSSLGESKIGKPVVGVKVAHKGHSDVFLYFDKGTGLLFKMEQTVRPDDPKGKPMKQEMFASDYKDVEGVKVPGKIVLRQDGKPFVEAETFDLKPVGKLDNKMFEKP